MYNTITCGMVGTESFWALWEPKRLSMAAAAAGGRMGG